MAERRQERQMLTAREALQLGTERLTREGIEGAALDMSLILAETLGMNRLGLYLNLDRPLDEEEKKTARAMLTRRVKHEPMAYILGRREFFGLTFQVTPAVLIPRPETEHLVEQAVAWIRELPEDQAAPLLVDIGTGSGAIAVAVAHACPNSRWIATDISEAALAVASENAVRLGVADRIEFRLGSLLEPVTETVDAICSNPPYVADKERAALAPDVANYEPATALFSGPEGFDHIRKIVEQAAGRLRPGGALLLECGAGQDELVADLIAEHGSYGLVRIHPDLAGIGRVVQTERTQ